MIGLAVTGAIVLAFFIGYIAGQLAEMRSMLKFLRDLAEEQEEILRDEDIDLADGEWDRDTFLKH